MTTMSVYERMLGYELFEAYPNISCFTTTRLGGCGEGAYGTFNCSPFCGDDTNHVLRNQEELYRHLPQSLHRLMIPFQVHGTEIAWVDRPFTELSEAEQHERLHGVDAVITTEPGCCVCVSTADCVPLLIYDREHQAVAAIHAGWRGTVDRIVTRTLEAMCDKLGTSGSQVVAAIGPSISVDSFEVGEEVFESFQAKGFDMSRISVWKAETQKHHIDLWEANRAQLQEFGVKEENIACANICTFISHNKFFSARRLGIKSGRMLSGIMMK